MVIAAPVRILSVICSEKNLWLFPFYKFADTVFHYSSRHGVFVTSVKISRQRRYSSAALLTAILSSAAAGLLASPATTELKARTIHASQPRSSESPSQAEHSSLLIASVQVLQAHIYTQACKKPQIFSLI